MIAHMTDNPSTSGRTAGARLSRRTSRSKRDACAQPRRTISPHLCEARHMVVGYDTRFLSDEFALSVARVSRQRIRVELADRPAPTPALSFESSRRACGGVVVTSSHQPVFRWNATR